MNDAPPQTPELTRWLETQRELMYLVAHDLRNPLAAIFANLNFLEIALPPDVHDALEAVADTRSSAEQLLRLIEIQVTLARLEADAPGTQKTAPSIVMADVVRAGLQRARPALESVGLAATFVGGETDAQIRAEAPLVEQIVEALAHNASQHVRRGGRVVFTLRAEPTQVILDLDDDGRPFGAPERDFGREGQIALKQGDGRYSRGLGLYLVGLATRALGGTIQPSTPERGAHLSLAFPRTA